MEKFHAPVPDEPRTKNRGDLGSGCTPPESSALTWRWSSVSNDLGVVAEAKELFIVVSWRLLSSGLANDNKLF